MRKIIAILFCICAVSVNAQDRSFARTYTSNVLPKGAIDLELWHTSRIGRANTFYNAQDQRMELEFGLGKNIQTAFYFNRYQQRFSTGANGTETSNETGFSNEWKFKLSDPTANRIGSALYFEAGMKGGDEIELETKIILDKYIGKNLFAFNAVAEFEKEFEWKNSGVKSNGWSTPIEFDLAYQYSLRPRLGVGFEIVNKNDIAKGEGWKNSLLYAGPTLNFRNDKWFVIVNYLPQLVNVHKTIYAPGKTELTDHERAEARILVGISL